MSTRSMPSDGGGGALRRRWSTRAVAGFGALLLGAGLLPGLPAAPAAAADGQGFTLNASDLRFILNQIRIAEQHAATATPTNPCGTLLGARDDQIPNQNAQGAELPWGLRTVDGTCNNLKPGQEEFGSAERIFPRRAPAQFDVAGPHPGGGFPPANGTPNSTYATPTGAVYDTVPRLASNLVVDQTPANPAALAAADVPEGTTPPAFETLFIPNVAPDVGLSAPFNSMFTLFGQFFDHGLDLVDKSGGTVFVPLRPDDPLVAGPDHVFGTGDDLPESLRFMVLTRATTAAGPDGVTGTADDREATNKTSPFVDQSQTYTSDPSHQFFLRQYAINAAGDPEGTGRLLTGPGGGLATWADVKAQALTLGIVLTDQDVFDVPMIATDPYGQFLPDAAGNPQIVTADGLVSTVPGAPAALPGNTLRTGQAFLDDIAHNAVPRSRTGPLAPDGDGTITGAGGTQDPGTYDDEMLNAHFVAGDGRINENIGLTAVHHVFHAEHNRLVGDITTLLSDPANAALMADYQAPHTLLTGGPDVSFGFTDRLFQAARFVTEMEYQHLAFEEFARKVQPQVNVFAGYDTSIDAAIPAEFAHAVYRFGHSMLTETVARRTTTGGNRDIELLDAFLNPPAFYDAGVDPDAAVGDIVRGMTDQTGNEIDEFVTEALRNNLLGLPLDLSVLNMARARDTGIPSLNEARARFFELTNGNSALAPYANWIDFGLGLRHHDSVINFVAAYGRHPAILAVDTDPAVQPQDRLSARRAVAALIVAGNPTTPGTPPDSVDFMNGTGAWATQATGLDDVDLWLGGLAEAQAPFGGLLGSTFNFVFETTMENLQDGDRFYYLTRTAGLNLLVQLEGNSFAELISRNSNAENLPADVFSRPDLTFVIDPATGLVRDNPDTPDVDESTLVTRDANGTLRYAGPLHVLWVGTVNPDRVRSSEGDDTLRGNEADDVLEGGAGNDQFVGGSGNDLLSDTFGDDVLKGGDGNDRMSSGPGFDLNQGGLGNDFVVGGSDPTETFGGPGNDLIFAGDSSDTVFGDDGDDWIEGGGQADLLQGDNGAPFQDDPNTPGHDVINGNGGQDDYDAEGGDDILLSGPGIERNEGMQGFDWVTHKNDPQAADDDLSLIGLLPPSVDALRDRFDLVEALSGGTFDDILRGDNRSLDVDAGVEGTMVGNELTAEGIARISGLAALLPAGATSFSAGNILIGGEGSDTIEGRGGDDVIHGDWWLNVQLRAPNAATPDPADFNLYDSMMSPPVGAPTSPTLRADVFAGRVDAGDIQIVRSIVTSAPGAFEDTAVFSGPVADYDVTVNPDGTTTVVHARGTLADGTDTLHGIEQLVFGGVPAAQVPDAPAIVSVQPGNTQVTVTFTSPADDGGSPITSFEVRAFAGTTVAATVTGIPATATSATVTGLTNGTAYTFQVVAVNAVGSSAPSASSAAVTPVAPGPSAPTIGTATPGNARATVRWTAPTDTGGSAITSYQVEVLTGTTLVRTVTGIAATATSTVVTSLTNGTEYNFRVRAVNANGPGALSAPSNVVIPASTPGAPTIGTATAGNASATVTWTPPTNDGGSPITSYSVQVRTGTTVVRTVTGIAATATSTVITGLTNGTAYNFRVRAVNAIGNGVLSTASNTVTPTAGTTTGTVPGAPTIGTASPGNARATVRWTAPTDNGGSAITSYQVEVLTGTTVVRTVTGIAATATSTVVTSLTNGTTYTFRVRAVNASGNGALSAASNPVTPAATPTRPIIGTAVAGVAGGAITATANWSPPTSDGGSPITGYIVRALLFNASGTLVSTTVSAVQPATARSLQMTLPTAGNYRFTVQARNDIGTSPQSARSNLVAGR